MNKLGARLWYAALVVAAGFAFSCGSDDSDSDGGGGAEGTTETDQSEAGSSNSTTQQGDDAGDDTSADASDDTGADDSAAASAASSCEDVAAGAGDCMGYYSSGSGTVAEKTCLIRQCIACEETNGNKGMCEFMCPDTCPDLFQDYLDCMFAMDCSGDTESSVTDQATACEQALASACGY